MGVTACGRRRRAHTIPPLRPSHSPWPTTAHRHCVSGNGGDEEARPLAPTGGCSLPRGASPPTPHARQRHRTVMTGEYSSEPNEGPNLHSKILGCHSHALMFMAVLKTYNVFLLTSFVLCRIKTCINIAEWCINDKSCFLLTLV